MKSHEEHRTVVDDRIAELARATEGLEPRADFTARVMRAVERDARAPMEGGGWLEDLLLPARRLVPIAALAAAVAVVWALHSQSVVDDDVTGTDDTVELEW